MSQYHTRTNRKCKYCSAQAKRNIKDGRNKGFYRTCGSKECTTAHYRDPDISVKKAKPLGKEHYKWKADRKLIKRPICSAEGMKWRRQVFERDNYTCKECGQRGRQLNAHHIFSYKYFPELRFELDNGITLCVLCHSKTDTYAGKGRQSVTI